MKSNVLIEKRWIDSVKSYSDDVRLSFYEYIFDYVFSEESNIIQDNPKNPMGYMAFNMVRPFLDEIINKYNAVVERNRANGSKGGRPRKIQENPKNPVGFLKTQENPKNLDIDMDIDIDIDNNNISSSLHSEDYSIADAKEDIVTSKEIEIFIEYWNKNLPLLKISRFTDTRKSKLKVRLKEIKDSTPTETLKLLVDNIVNSSFLQGDNNRGFKGTIDWVIKNESNFTKVLEGRYNDTTKETTTTSKPGPSYDSREARETEHARLRERIQARLLGGMGTTTV